MDNRFQLDRVEVPKFYTPIITTGLGRTFHKGSNGKVFTPSSDHSTLGWMSLGYVSKQTPLGQGTFLGFPTTKLREATKEEVLAALKLNHPFGKSFRPHCEEAANAGFHLAMASAIGNWTNDNVPDDNIIGVSKQDLKNAAEKAVDHHKELMRRWRAICLMQKQAIRAALAA